MDLTPSQLIDRLFREKFTILDIRKQTDVESWKIDGGAPTLNIPYTEILEQGGQADLSESVVACGSTRCFEQIPKDQPVVTVCYRGRSSVMVARGLRDLGYDAVSLAGGMESWGSFYDFRPVVENAELAIYEISRPARGCLSYVVASKGEALVIDPFRHIDRYIDFLREKRLNPRLVIDTHAHADHISGGRTLADALSVPYALHPYDAIHPFDVVPARIAYQPIHDNEEFTIGSVTLRALHVPGHTLGNIALTLGDRHLFAGDSVFLESIARPDLGNRASSWAALHYASLRRILELPEEMQVLPGHFRSVAERNASGIYAATLGELRQSNRELQLALKDEGTFIEQVLQKVGPFPEKYIEIKRVNAGIHAADPEQAAELEQGKNLCAVSR